MKTYLKVVNPIAAGLVLLLCLIAASFDEGAFKPHALLRGGIPTYFLAKGLFCSSALFILGQLLLVLIGGERNTKQGGA
jgi:hypothetical protein